MDLHLPSPDLPPASSERRRDFDPRPHSDEELDAALRRPHRLLEIVLGEPERLVADAEQGRRLPTIFLLLAAASTLFAVPYGLVLGVSSFWKVATLYLGSTLICLPSLHVFALYLGVAVKLRHNLVLALAIPAVAGLFSLGFAPILGFFKLTMGDAGSSVRWQTLSVLLLGAALLAGIGQLWRSIHRARGLSPMRDLPFLVVGWHVVFLYVLGRMASVLGLDG